MAISGEASSRGKFPKSLCFSAGGSRAWPHPGDTWGKTEPHFSTPGADHPPRGYLPHPLLPPGQSQTLLTAGGGDLLVLGLRSHEDSHDIPYFSLRPRRREFSEKPPLSGGNLLTHLPHSLDSDRLLPPWRVPRAAISLAPGLHAHLGVQPSSQCPNPRPSQRASQTSLLAGMRAEADTEHRQCARD